MSQIVRMDSRGALADWFTEFRSPYSAYPGDLVLLCNGKFKDVADDEWWITQSFFLKITNMDTGEEILETPTITMFKGTEATFGSGPTGPNNPMGPAVFTRTMPSTALNLRLELVEWFLLSADGASFREQIRAYVDFTIQVSSLPPVLPPPVPQPGKANVYGMIFDAKTYVVIVGAKVTLDSQSQYSDADGLFYFLNVDLGSYKLRAEVTGYSAYSATVEATVTGEYACQVAMSTKVTPSFNALILAVPMAAVIGGAALGRKDARKKVRRGRAR